MTGLIKAFHLFVYETTRYISPFAIATEWVFVAIGIALVLLAPIKLGVFVNRMHDLFLRLANRKGLAIVLAGLFPVASRLLLLPVASFPEPSIHDEFSHLLLADTLSSGRLTNPTHPMWQHFESVHIIQRPTYNSMYPPGQGMLLALGQMVFHHPWFGVLISVGLMSTAVCWMLQGWLPSAWASYGALVLSLKIGIVGFWMNSYMGGAPAALGGALVIGSLPRLMSRPTRTAAALLGLGMFILLNTRPFEGGVLTFCALLWLVVQLWPRIILSRGLFLRRAAIPVAAVFGLGLVWTGYYCWRVTGSPVRMPYLVNRDTYGWPENLAIIPPKHIEHTHPMLRVMYEKELLNRTRYSSPARIVDSLDTRFFDSWVFFVGPVLTLPMLVLPWAIKTTHEKFLLGLMVVSAALNLLQLLLYPQHLGQVTGVIFALLMTGMAWIYRFISRVSVVRARYAAVIVPILLIMVGAMKLEGERIGVPLSYWERAYEAHRDIRAWIEQDMENRPGKQLIIVRYSPFHSPDQEWVYNRADIDKSKVVWARDMDPASNQQLIRYFRDRTAWLLEPDVFPIQTVPYPVPSAFVASSQAERTQTHR